jgi:hypothetical protein
VVPIARTPGLGLLAGPDGSLVSRVDQPLVGQRVAIFSLGPGHQILVDDSAQEHDAILLIDLAQRLGVADQVRAVGQFLDLDQCRSPLCPVRPRALIAARRTAGFEIKIGRGKPSGDVPTS